jgi:hypothetical protein
LFQWQDANVPPICDLQLFAIMLAGEPFSHPPFRFTDPLPPLSEVVNPCRPDYKLAQFRLFDLEDALGEGWLKALKLEEYAPRRPQWSQALQQVLFTYTEVL